VVTEKGIVDVLDAETLDVVARLEAPLTLPTSGVGFGPRGDVIVASTTSQLFRIWRVDRIRPELDRLGIEHRLEW
jgi:hypothetical protein